MEELGGSSIENNEDNTIPPPAATIAGTFAAAGSGRGGRAVADEDIPDFISQLRRKK